MIINYEYLANFIMQATMINLFMFGIYNGVIVIELM